LGASLAGKRQGEGHTYRNPGSPDGSADLI
jgi:hypothetical protein